MGAILSIYGRNHEDGTFNWKDAIIDAGIMACLTFFTSLGGMSATAIITSQTVIGSAIAGVTQFFLVLAIKRGLRKEENK